MATQASVIPKSRKSIRTERLPEKRGKASSPATFFGSPAGGDDAADCARHQVTSSSPASKVTGRRKYEKEIGGAIPSDRRRQRSSKASDSIRRENRAGAPEKPQCLRAI